MQLAPEPGQERNPRERQHGDRKRGGTYRAPARKAGQSVDRSIPTRHRASDRLERQKRRCRAQRVRDHEDHRCAHASVPACDCEEGVPDLRDARVPEESSRRRLPQHAEGAKQERSDTQRDEKVGCRREDGRFEQRAAHENENRDHSRELRHRRQERHRRSIAALVRVRHPGVERERPDLERECREDEPEGEQRRATHRGGESARRGEVVRAPATECEHEPETVESETGSDRTLYEVAYRRLLGAARAGPCHEPVPHDGQTRQRNEQHHEVERREQRVREHRAQRHQDGHRRTPVPRCHSS